ncbi:ORF2 [Torque teno mustelid virus 2]|nr:ORF2 [Torque teno mustelid virus 2]QSX73451.1 ORF2 [Torque teno mustelid virus 2]
MAEFILPYGQSREERSPLALTPEGGCRSCAEPSGSRGLSGSASIGSWAYPVRSKILGCATSGSRAVRRPTVSGAPATTGSPTYRDGVEIPPLEVETPPPTSLPKKSPSTSTWISKTNPKGEEKAQTVPQT